MIRRTTQEELYKFIGGLFKDFVVIGPKEAAGKGVSYQTISTAAELYLGDSFTLEPVKKLFFNPSEYIFKQANGTLEEIPQAKVRRMILGVRPCEARGLILLDKVFDSEYVDDFYANRRKDTIIVGFGCLNPDSNCFCTSMGGSPTESRGMDALIFNSENEFIIELITDQAKDIFSLLGQELGSEESEVWELEKGKRNRLAKQIRVPDNLDAVFESDYWEKVSFPCIGCGICTYLCPTCHCFDLADDERKKLRCYDSCAFSDFTLEASGENSRPTKKERYRQRVLHKFNYFKKNFGENLCVGCGRCIRHCPVKMDISEIVVNAA